jgi:CspA family cold shock protein
LKAAWPPFSFRVCYMPAAAISIGADLDVYWYREMVQCDQGIQPQGGGKDVFVHISAVERAGLSGLNEGQVVEYEEVSNKGKTSAENLKVRR